jgi:DNA-binding YbaB/EbfC family protein
MFEKLKQFKDLRDKAKEIQTTLAVEKVEGSGAWNKIKIEMDGNQNVTSVTVADELLAVSEKTKLQDGMRDAINDAVKKAQRKMMEKMKDMGGLPGMR